MSCRQNGLASSLYNIYTPLSTVEASPSCKYKIILFIFTSAEQGGNVLRVSVCLSVRLLKQESRAVARKRRHA